MEGAVDPGGVFGVVVVGGVVGVVELKQATFAPQELPSLRHVTFPPML